MNSVVLHLLAYAASFVALWFGSGLVISEASTLARSFRLPAFTVSFFLLGILTSLPEITVGTQSILNDDPAIFAGNLLGAMIVIFLGIIPLLAIVNNGVKIPKSLPQSHLVLTMVVILAPYLLVADHRIGYWEGILLICLYLTQAFFFSRKKTVLEKISSALRRRPQQYLVLLVKVLVGVVILVFASFQVVSSTMYFSDMLQVSPFLVSLIVVAIGTNLPELSLVVRSVFQRSSEIALADFIGSASANTLLFGVFTVVYGRPIILPNSFFQRFALLFVGLILFLFFARSRKVLSRMEGFVLFACYLLFLAIEILLVF